MYVEEFIDGCRCRVFVLCNVERSGCISWFLECNLSFLEGGGNMVGLGMVFVSWIFWY